MKTIIALLIFSSCAILCLADSTGSYYYSLKKYPEITKLLNDNQEYSDCGTFVDVVSGTDKIFKLASIGDTETYLVSYIDDCENPWIYGSVLFDKNSSGFHKSKLTLPYLFQIEIDSVKYSLHQESSHFSDNILSVNYDVACREDDEYLPLGICASFTSYTVSLKYKFQDKAFILIEKLVSPNNNP